MRLPWRDRVQWWVGEVLAATWNGVLRYDGVAPGGRSRYVNRITGHVVVR